MFGGDGDDLAPLALLDRALDRPVERLGRAAGEDEPSLVEPDRGQHLVARMLDRRRRLARPSATANGGLANFSSIHGRIAAATSGATGVVAW